MTTTLTIEDVIDALDAASAALRRRSAAPGDAGLGHAARYDDVVAHALAIHPQLGTRQMQVLRLLQEAEPSGTTTGDISRAIRYDQPNVYVTLRALIGHGFAQRDNTTVPHTYRLGRQLRDEPSSP